MLWEKGEVVELGLPAGYDSSSAMAISSSGTVAGVVFAAHGQIRAVLWDAGDMTLLDPLPGDTDCLAFALNDAGQIVGVSGSGFTGSGYLNVDAGRAVIWEDGRVSALTSLTEGGAGAALAINQAGQAVGSAMDADGTGHAVLWDDRGVTDLGVPGSAAYGCNVHGQVVGFADVEDGESRHAILWEDGRMVDLGALQGHMYSIAMAINDDGVVVGYSSEEDSYDAHAVRWTGGRIEDLGIPPIREPCDAINAHVRDQRLAR